MDNLKLPAYPCIDSYESGAPCTNQTGFTKLELASLMVAQGSISGGALIDDSNVSQASKMWVAIAKSVLEEANK